MVLSPPSTCTSKFSTLPEASGSPFLLARAVKLGLIWPLHGYLFQRFAYSTEFPYLLLFLPVLANLTGQNLRTYLPKGATLEASRVDFAYKCKTY